MKWKFSNNHFHLSLNYKILTIPNSKYLNSNPHWVNLNFIQSIHSFFQSVTTQYFIKKFIDSFDLPINFDYDYLILIIFLHDYYNCHLLSLWIVCLNWTKYFYPLQSWKKLRLGLLVQSFLLFLNHCHLQFSLSKMFINCGYLTNYRNLIVKKHQLFLLHFQFHYRVYNCKTLYISFNI